MLQSQKKALSKLMFVISAVKHIHNTHYSAMWELLCAFPTLCADDMDSKSFSVFKKSIHYMYSLCHYKGEVVLVVGVGTFVISNKSI